MHFERKSGIVHLAVPLLVWAGMVIAISMEAVVKFHAPSVTLEIGVDVGRQVFPALMKAEWILAVIAVCLFSLNKRQRRRLTIRPGVVYFGLAAIACLVFQTLVLLPQLMHQADMLLAGQVYTSNNIHIWYVLVTKIKVIALFIAAHFSLSSQPEDEFHNVQAITDRGSR